MDQIQAQDLIAIAVAKTSNDLRECAKKNWTPAAVEDLKRLLCAVIMGKEYAEVTEQNIEDLEKEHKEFMESIMDSE